MKTYIIAVPCMDSVAFAVTAASAEEAMQKLKDSDDCMEYHRKTYDGQYEWASAEVVDEEGE